MAGGQTDEWLLKRVETLERLAATQAATILKMQQVGGFADSKQLSVRSQRLEDRVEVLEFDDVMQKDVVAHFADLVGRHLNERHSLDLDRSQDPDVIFLRKIRRRLREWTEATGLMRKRRDVRETRNDENRLRPSAAQS